MMTDIDTVREHLCIVPTSFLQSSEDSSFQKFLTLTFCSACEIFLLLFGILTVFVTNYSLSK